MQERTYFLPKRPESELPECSGTYHVIMEDGSAQSVFYKESDKKFRTSLSVEYWLKRIDIPNKEGLQEFIDKKHPLRNVTLKEMFVEQMDSLFDIIISQ